MGPRQRRLMADWEALRTEYSGHNAVVIEPIGPLPPEEYVITYKLRGIRVEDNVPRVTEEHKVRVQLPLEYPRQAPYCVPMTPLFHPNVAQYFCIGDYWAAGEGLADIVAKIGDMIQFRIFNTASPLDTVAAHYADENPTLFPIGNIDIRSPDIEVGRLQRGDTSEGINTTTIE